jgi:hypothetical protein
MAAGVAAAAVIFAAIPARGGVACPTYEGIFFCGELSGDCKVTAVDALQGLKMAVGQVEAAPEVDVSLDGEATAVDALRLLRIAVGSLPPTLSCAGQRGLVATSTGFYNQAGTRSSNGFATGWYAANGGNELRNYLIFDLSVIDGMIGSAVLRLSTGPDAQDPYTSADPSETYKLFHIATPVATLTNNGGTAAFADLGAGFVYGELVATNSQVEHVVNIPLNENGVNFLREYSEPVALGGAITTLAKGATNEHLFNSTANTFWRHLVVTVESW